MLILIFILYIIYHIIILYIYLYSFILIIDKSNNNNNDDEENDNYKIDFNDLSDQEVSSPGQIDIFNTLDQEVYNNNAVDELRKKKQLLSEYITDPKDGEPYQEIVINPQLTRIIFDTNCYIVSLKTIKNIFENTNLNIIIPLA
eukprot:jgi/Orpsp1_1/1182684/evm.model.c7180000082226.2